MAYLSKSLIKASGCEFYLSRYYLDARDGDIASPLSETGQQIHSYKAQYIDHLARNSKRQDRDWANDWRKGQNLSEDADAVVARDAEEFEIEPDWTYATEQYLGVDGGFKASEKRSGHLPGTGPGLPHTQYGGTLDWVELVSPTKMRIWDWKTGYSLLGQSETESAMYAALAFAHFPHVTHIEFTWSYVRLRIHRTVNYERADLTSWIWPTLFSAYQRFLDIAERHKLEQPMSVNPMAGLCGFCQLECPMLTMMRGGIARGMPIQTPQDAAKAAQALFVAKQWQQREEAALKLYLMQHGPLDLGQGFTAELKTQDVKTYPLPKTIDLLLKNPEHGIPLEKLTVGGLSGYLKARKRKDLREELVQIAGLKHRTVLSVAKTSDPEQVLLGGEEDE